MLLFQQDLRQRQHNELKRILLYSSIAHLVGIITIFIATRTERVRISLGQTLDDAIVVVMPLYKNIPLDKLLPAKKDGIIQQVKNKAQKNSSTHREFHSASAYVPKKKSVAKASPASKILREPVVKKTNVKDIQPDVPASKFVRKKKEQTKVDNNSIPTVQKNNEVLAAQEVVSDSQATNAAVVHIGREDAQLLQEVQDIRNAILPHWHAPVGCATNAECEIIVTIDKHGQPQDVKITKSSGVLAFDCAARAAILRSQFPVYKWGSSMTLLFG